MFHDHGPAGAEDALLENPPDGVRRVAGGVGRVQEHDVDPLALGGQGREDSAVIGVQHLQALAKPQLLAVSTDQGGACGGSVHADGLRRASGQGLQAHIPGPGEKVEDRRAGHLKLDAAEDGFLHPIQRGPGVPALGGVEAPSPGGTGYDPQVNPSDILISGAPEDHNILWIRGILTPFPAVGKYF